jgi:DNA-binding LacI/PurR family transcriptional regulator
MTDNGEWRRSGRVTLRDVAQQAGVSRALVSIVMRDARGASDATRARVKMVAQELGYRPDVRARSLAGQKSRLIGVMFGVGVGSFHFDLLDGLYAAAEQHGLSLVLTALTVRRDEQVAAESLRDFRFDAVIMLGPETPRPLLAGKVPVVVIGWNVQDPTVDVVRTSDEDGMRQAVDHLVGLGHHRIAHLDGGEGLVASSRREGYLAAMRDQGLSSEIRVLPGGRTPFDGQRAARRLLREGSLPTALVTFNDDAAVSVMGQLSQAGIDVPKQLSMVGWDDSVTATHSPVPLTTVAQQPAELARLALERIVTRLEHRRVESHQIVLAPELKVRSSTQAINLDSMS